MFKDNMNLVGADIGFLPPSDNFSEARKTVFLNAEAEAQNLKQPTSRKNSFNDIQSKPETFEQAKNDSIPAKDSQDLKEGDAFTQKTVGENLLKENEVVEPTGVSPLMSGVIIFTAVAVAVIAIYSAYKTKKVVKPF